MSRYNEIMQSLHEAFAYVNGDPSVNATVHKMSVSSVPDAFTPEEIKEIRLNAKMTQSIFASCIGVTKKAVEAWEGGRSKPDGAARRTLGLFKQNPRYADDVGIIVR